MNIFFVDAAKGLPGMVRNLQEYPFKIELANFDMLWTGAKYLLTVEDSTVHIDSSGKFWQERRRTGQALLNTAIVLPPFAEGLSPFLLYELISERNRSQDFVDLLGHCWQNLGLANNNVPVPYPAYAVCDMSFPNIHSILKVFNGTNIHDYLEFCYEKFKDGEPLSATILTICVNHLLPAILKSSRSQQSKKIADTVVAGFMQVLQASSLSECICVWEKLVKVHVKKTIDEGARKEMEQFTLGDVPEPLELNTDFGDESDNDEIVMYGSRKAIRVNSPFFKLFDQVIIRIIDSEEEEECVNSLYCPDLIKYLCKQYLSLLPIFSAICLKDGLMTNSQVELHWKYKRSIMSKIPNPQQWPAEMIGIQHFQCRDFAKEVRLHSLLPNLRTGGKRKHDKDANNFLSALSQNESSNSRYFRPTQKRKERDSDNDSVISGQENWTPKRRKIERKTYIKNKVINYAKIDNSQETIGPLTVTDKEKKYRIVISKKDLVCLNGSKSCSSSIVDAGLMLLQKAHYSSSPQMKVAFYLTADLR